MTNPKFRTAVCLSGHIRNLEQNFNNLKEFILEPFENPDIFIHTWGTYGWRAEGNNIELGHKTFKGFDHYSNKINEEKIINLLMPKRYYFENFLDKETEFKNKASFLKPNSQYQHDRHENTVGTAYKIFKCNELKTQYEKENNFVYDIVIRSRPDIIYSKNLAKENYLLNCVLNNTLITPDIDPNATDWFAMGSSKVMDSYSNILNKLVDIHDSGRCGMNPHQIYKYYFDNILNYNWIKYPCAIQLNRCRNLCNPLPTTNKNNDNNHIFCQNCDPNKQILSNIFEG